MVLIELVYCKITGRTRALPKIHHFVPLEPWSCKKIKGKKRVMHVADNRQVRLLVKGLHHEMYNLLKDYHFKTGSHCI